MTTTYNQAPTHNHAPDNGDVLRDQDPAADIVDTARDLRTSLYESGAPASELDTMFNDQIGGGIDGAKELLDLTDTIRSENRPLDPNEQKFVDYMKAEAALKSAQATVDYDALSAPYNDAIGNDAVVERVKEMIASRDRIARISASDVQKQRLEDQNSDLRAFLAVNRSDARVADAFMNAHREHAISGTPDAKAALDDAELALDTSKTEAEIIARACTVISEEYSRTPDNPADLDTDPRLAYVPAQTDPEQAPDQPAIGDQPAAASAKQEKLNAIRAEMEQKELATIRDQLAANKSRLFGKGGPETEELEARYNALIKRQAAHEYGDILGDPDVDPDIKRYVATKAVFEEQARLREATNEKMKNTIPAKMGRWIGKHKFLTIAGMTVLVPLTGGTAAFGLAAGVGMLAASKADEKLRGMRSTEQSLTQTHLQDLMRDGYGFDAVQQYAMAKYEEDRNRERKKRYVTAGIGASALFATWGILPPMSGLTNGIQGTQHFLWNSFLK